MTFLTIFSRCALALSLVQVCIGADLKPETIDAWKEYVKDVESRHHQHVAEGSFISADATPGEAAKLREGHLIVWPAPQVPVRVKSGLIHDWSGSAFVPDITIPDLLRVVRDYAKYKDVYHPFVLASELQTSTETEDHYSLILANRSVVAKSALDFDYRTTYTKIDEHHWVSVTESMRVQEIADYGKKSAKTLPEDHGTGLIWRMYSVARFEEKDGGVYVEVEAVALSRDIPGGIRWMVEPIVRRVSRSALETSLKQTGEAIEKQRCAGSKKCETVAAAGAGSRLR